MDDVELLTHIGRKLLRVRKRDYVDQSVSRVLRKMGEIFLELADDREQGYRAVDEKV